MAITHAPGQPRILIAGCGALGGMIAHQLSHQATVFGLRRSAGQVPEGVHPIAADLLQPDQLAERLPGDLDALVYCLTPGRYDDEGYRQAYVTGLGNLLKAATGQPVKRVVFISSTSVYHQDDDSWVTEDSPTEPKRHSGQRILEGERLALAGPFPATVVRFSGIYGPSRRRFLTAVQNGEMNPSLPAPYSNRIHEADAAAAVVHLLNLALNGQPLADRYIASDCDPARLDEVVNWVRGQVPCAAPQPDARTGGRAGSKRCDNRRLLATGFRFRYPDYRAGYGEMIEQERSQN
ncbi:MAG: NAD(P)H-binding protein [Marinobacter sp.]|uniref:NAD-dependent epimerase/dehydratase family protein n=1 Tax=Marinobacter sp. TaxID=50741 RepID=UPI00299D7B62|nr:NAD(P)H-binding protein [Marinobacter sp.]MDX1755115.1 NAD(P)H-binding protein [Marinobacter sp.]